MNTSVISGLPAIIVGMAIIWVASGYPIGSAMRMGPGYLPLVGGIVLVLLGLVIAITDREPLERLDARSIVRPVAFVFAALIAWTLIVVPFGLVAATLALVILSSLAAPNASLRTIALTAAFLSIFGVLVFLTALNLRLTAFGL